MSTPDYAQTPPPQPTPMAKFFAWSRSLGMARPGNRMLGGVAAATARRLGMDLGVTRILFVVLAIVAGAGVGLYIVAWICLPDERTGVIPLESWVQPKTT